MGRVVPSFSVQAPAAVLDGSWIAATSSSATWALPSCVTGTQNAPLPETRAGHRLTCSVRMTRQPPLIDLIGDETADFGMHPPRDGRKMPRSGGIVA